MLCSRLSEEASRPQHLSAMEFSNNDVTRSPSKGIVGQSGPKTHEPFPTTLAAFRQYTRHSRLYATVEGSGRVLRRAQKRPWRRSLP